MKKEVTDWYIRELRSKIDANISWYSRWLSRYFNDPWVDLRARWEITSHYHNNDGSIKFNVIKAVIDSVVSSLYNNKVLASFIPVNGLPDTVRACKDAQQYFDIMYEHEKINKKVNDVARMACIFGRGHLFINPVTYKVEPLSPHLVAFLNMEKRYGASQRCLIHYYNFPISKLSEYPIPKRKLPNETQLTCEFEHYIDCELRKQLFFINGMLVLELPYEHDVLPILTLYYNQPVFGEQTTGLVQELDSIQLIIDDIADNMAEAIRSTPTNQIFLQTGSGITRDELDNRGGAVYLVKPVNSVTGPQASGVTVANPVPYDQFWKQTMDMWKEYAFEQVGKSELSSMGRKPAGLDSGASLKTFIDIESDRFETQTTNYIDSFEDLAKLLIEILPEDQDILPQSLNSSSMKWGDVKRQSKLFKIQYVPISMLSKDPGENQKLIMQFSQSGQIPLYKFARLFNSPDIAEVFNDASAKYDGVRQCVYRALKDEDYDIPIWVEKATLAQEISVEQNKLYSCLTGDKENDKLVEESLKRLMQLEATLKEDMQKNGYVQPDVAEEMVGSDEVGQMGGMGTTNQIADVTSEVDNINDASQSLREEIDSNMESVGVEQELGNA